MNIQTTFAGGQHPVFRKSITAEDWAELRHQALIAEHGDKSLVARSYYRNKVLSLLQTNGALSQAQVIEATGMKHNQVAVILNFFLYSKKIARIRKPGTTADGRVRSKLIFYQAKP